MADNAAIDRRGSPAPQDRTAAPPAPSAPRRFRSRRLAVRLIAGVLALSAAAGAYWYVTRTEADRTGMAQAAAPPPVTVSQPVQRNIVEWDEYTGQFAAV